MTHVALLFDLTLMATLISLAWLLLASRDLFRAIVLFISFGLLLALAWTRLGAVDVALAEAAIGAGITGALLLVGLGRLGSREHCRRTPQPTTLLQRLTPAVLIGLILPLVTLILLLALQPLKIDAPGQQKLVLSALDISGTDHPVTAVLLNFRAWDTLLEKAVLLLALVSIWSLDRARPLFHHQSLSPVLNSLSQVYVPIVVIVSGALLWQGGYVPGGAFQAGALLSAGILLAILGGRTISALWTGLPLRLLAACGLLIFILVTALTLVSTGLPLQYPPSLAGPLILLIEIAATVSIAVILAADVAGGRPNGIDAANQHQASSAEEKS